MKNIGAKILSIEPMTSIAMRKITKYTKCILVTRCKSDHHICLEKTRQMMKNETMLN